MIGSLVAPSERRSGPVSADEIAQAAIGAHEAGAAIVHLHARNPTDGRPDQSPEAFAPFLGRIKKTCNVVVNITTGGAPTMGVDERLKPCAHFKPEVASLNMGTMNFGLYEMLPRQKSWTHDWEPKYLAGSEAGMFKNTLKDIADILRLCGPNGTRFTMALPLAAPRLR